jgi:hypothetical protein
MDVGSGFCLGVADFDGWGLGFGGFSIFFVFLGKLEGVIFGVISYSFFEVSFISIFC